MLEPVNPAIASVEILPARLRQNSSSFANFDEDWVEDHLNVCKYSGLQP